MSPDLADIWPDIQGRLRGAVDSDTYDVWLGALRPVSLDGETLTLEAPAEARAWIAERFAAVLRASAAAALGHEVGIDVVVRGRHPAARGAAATDPRPEAPHGGLNPKYTFDQFVIGDTNRLAHAAALAVAELPGQAYNPLFIYGPPGVGKTHLLHSIGNYVRTYGGGLTVRYATIETFTNEFVAALQSKGGIERFKGRYRRADVLLIDDVQFLESKVKTEEEFFHTFNALHEMGSQLVLTCDRLPRDMAALEERLRERFEAGLLTDIRNPDMATRLTVLRKRVAHDGIPIGDDGVLEQIAARIDSNIRALEGALIRVVAFASLTGRPLVPALAAEVLGDLYPEDARTAARPRTWHPITVGRIQELTCEEFSITREDLLSSSRAARVAWPRHLAMYLAREHTDETLPAIGAQFGGRNHTTVMHACKRAAARIASDPDAYAAVRALTERITAPLADRND